MILGGESFGQVYVLNTLVWYNEEIDLKTVKLEDGTQIGYLQKIK